jgi:hypothetical protein
MTELTDVLTKKRNQLLERIRGLQDQVDVLNEMIEESETGKPQKRAKAVKAKSATAELYMNTIRRLLRDSKVGKTTKDLHHVIEVVTNRDLNYSTFRSYLNRMKEEKEISQDENRHWHIN